MASKEQHKRILLDRYLAERRPAEVDEGVLAEIAKWLAPISQTYLRRLVRGCGVKLAPLVEGVRQENLNELQRTLLALQAEYERASATGDHARMQACRKLVIEAKDHARFSLRRIGQDDPRRRVKQEAVEWMLVWLENPGVFRTWVGLRRRELEDGDAQGISTDST